jgi:hypothetical protein
MKIRLPGAVRPYFDAPRESGSGETPEQIAAREAAAKAAAEKAAADAAAAKEKADADRKAAEEAERIRLEKEKGSKLSDKEAELLREVMARKDKERETKAQLDAANQRLKEFDGIDPAKVKELIAAQEKAAADAKKAEQENLEKKGEWDRLKKMMGDDFNTKLAAKDEELKGSKTALQQANETIAKLTVGSAFANSDYIAKETVLTPDLARQAFGTHFETQPDGKVVEDSVKKLIESRADKEKLLRSKLAPGAGSGTTSARPNAQQTEQSGPKGVSRIALALSKGQLKSPAGASK